MSNLLYYKFHKNFLYSNEMRFWLFKKYKTLFFKKKMFLLNYMKHFKKFFITNVNFIIYIYILPYTNDKFLINIIDIWDNYSVAVKSFLSSNCLLYCNGLLLNLKHSNKFFYNSSFYISILYQKFILKFLLSFIFSYYTVFLYIIYKFLLKRLSFLFGLCLQQIN